MFNNMLSRLLGLSFSCFFIVSFVSANDSNFSGELALEGLYFFEEGLQGQKKAQPSLRAEVEYQKNLESDYFHFVLFGRVDEQDAKRSHLDVREAYWTHVADDWEILGGDRIASFS